MPAAFAAGEVIEGHRDGPPPRFYPESAGNPSFYASAAAQTTDGCILRLQGAGIVC